MSRWNLGSDNRAEHCNMAIRLKQFSTGMSLTLRVPLLIGRLPHLLVQTFIEHLLVSNMVLSCVPVSTVEVSDSIRHAVFVCT